MKYSTVLLITFLLLGFRFSAKAQSECKEIKATIEVFQAGEKAEKASIEIVLEGQSISLLEIALVGPKGYFKKDIQETVIMNLQKGNYTLVLSSKKESYNFCQKHFEFTIN